MDVVLRETTATTAIIRQNCGETNGIKRAREESAPAGASTLLAPATRLDPCLKCSRRGLLAVVRRAFKIGDHVTWNSEAGHVSGTVIAVHKRDVTWKGYVHHATNDEPQYEIRSDRTDHIALHKGWALAMFGARQRRRPSRKA